MKNMTPRSMKISATGISMAALILIVGLATPSGARADEADARNLLKAMSDYLAAQNALSFGYDTSFEVVTSDRQKLAPAPAWAESPGVSG